jgi:hypothetical protein
MVRRKKRDIYGNWVWEDEDVDAKSHQEEYKEKVSLNTSEENTPLLEWRDYLALVIASLETFLLPFVVLILLLFGLVLAFALLK